ncbi:MAG: hypothetical protein IH932_01290 [Thaumarchaeota archaeon]|nr:hypothetical protein [Nitrososphaerota archaeon]
MINSYDTDVHTAVLEASMKLADIFEDNIIEESYIDNGGEVIISEEGLELLGDAFEEIEPGLREAVFSSLLDELTERDVPYDIIQFQESHDA